MNQRFYSLDVFRGATVCLMILVNNPGSWAHIYPPLEHAEWHGLTPTDLVFPFFLFAVGNALSFVMPRLEAAGDAVFWKKVIKRTIIIFLIGVFLSWSPFFMWQGEHLVFKPWAWVDNDGNPQGVRILGVLQRIAICYFVASVIIYFGKIRLAFVIGLVILLVYWAMCLFLGDKTDPFSMTGYFGRDVDLAILHQNHMLHLDKVNGKLYYFDYEGITSTLPAIVQVIFGYLAGDYIRNKGKTPEMLNGLFVAGIALVLTGFCWDMVFPINKKIWTSSYTIYTTGLALLTISTMIWMIEFRGIRGGVARFFDVFGKNALFVFALSGFLPRLLGLIKFGDGTNPWNWLYKKLLVRIPGDPELGSLAYALCVILFMWFICWWMDKKKIYIKV